jgi:hypothetical protein
MPRNLSPAALAALSNNLGEEPVNILEIQWVGSGGRVSYADKDIPPSIKGAILSISGLDEVTQVSGGARSQAVSVVLDDADGTLKQLLDTIDIHKRPCWLYQWFSSIPLADKFLIFSGQINTPVEWNEGDRTLKFDIVSNIEDVEVGFSIEEGDFTNPPPELIGRPWPLCFGTVQNVPALRTRSPRQGILAQGTGIRDFTLQTRLRLAQKIVCPKNFQGYIAISVTGLRAEFVEYYEEDQNCKQQKCTLIENLKLQIQEQAAHEISPVTIFGGTNFPQNKSITLNINGGKFTGYFVGNTFHITARRHPANDGTGKVIQTPTQNTIASKCGPRPDPRIPPGLEGLSDGTRGVDQTILARTSKLTWDKYNAVQPANFFWANAGSAVTLDGDDEIVYIANLLPSTILRVAAWRELDGGRQLLTVPSEYYTVRQVNYTGYTGVTEIVMTRPLSTRDTGWSDDIYVSLTSSVGPNTVDILTWLINTYTSYSIDSASFNSVHALVDNYPMHFPLLVRKGIIQVLQEIAFQARCALWLKDNTFYIKYLPAEPVAVDTISADDIIANSLVIGHTRTEDLVTKYVAKWRADYANPKENALILRHNVKKYGTHEDEYDFYCFNILDLVRKAATFWLLRKANTWRLVSCKTTLKKLKLEPFDAVTLSLPQLSPNNFLGLVESATYNSDEHTIEFEIWTPIKAGTTRPYNLAWPADVEESFIFPTLEERALGLAGSGRQPNFSVIAPPGHPLATKRLGVYQGFSLACNGSPVVDLSTGACRPDHGTRKISDRGDSKPTPRVGSDNSGSISLGTSPIRPDPIGDIRNLIQQVIRDTQQTRNETAITRLVSLDINSDTQESNPDKKRRSKARKLPKKDQLEDDNCLYSVEVWFANINSVFMNCVGDTPVTQPGSIGRAAGTEITRTEIYTFNSQQAADAFYSAIRSEINSRDAGCGSWVVGQESAWLVSTQYSDIDSPECLAKEQEVIRNGTGGLVAFDESGPMAGQP